jgi:hypothetical protein
MRRKTAIAAVLALCLLLAATGCASQNGQPPKLDPAQFVQGAHLTYDVVSTAVFVMDMTADVDPAVSRQIHAGLDAARAALDDLDKSLSGGGAIGFDTALSAFRAAVTAVKADQERLGWTAAGA